MSEVERAGMGSGIDGFSSVCLSELSSKTELDSSSVSPLPLLPSASAYVAFTYALFPTGDGGTHLRRPLPSPNMAKGAVMVGEPASGKWERLFVLHVR